MSDRAFIARHAATILAGQLAIMGFGVTDTLVAGRYSDEALAAMSIGMSVFVSVFVALSGVVQALLPVYAEHHGAGRHLHFGRSVRQSLYLGAAVAVIGMAILLNPGPILRATAVPEALHDEVRGYLVVLGLSMPAGLIFRIYSTLNQALGRPQMVAWLQLGSLALKVPLTIWFAFGGLGLAPHGALGCAWATFAVNWLLALLALWTVRNGGRYRQYAVWSRMERPDWQQIRAFARLGVPAGLAILVEVTSFTLMALFIARQGITASGAHQIAANLCGVMYMVPLALGIAASARTSYWLGAGDAVRAKNSVRDGFVLGGVAALVLSVVVIAAREPVAHAYTNSPAVAALGASLLAWMALYHCADATQAIAVHLLRSYRITVAPLVTYCVLLWGVGLGGGYLLAYEGVGPIAAQNSPAAFWIASGIGLVLVALVLPTIVWRAARHGARAAGA